MSGLFLILRWASLFDLTVGASPKGDGWWWLLRFHMALSLPGQSGTQQRSGLASAGRTLQQCVGATLKGENERICECDQVQVRVSAPAGH